MSARIAAALAFASAAVTLYWTLGGTFGLDTVGGTFEELARDRSAGSISLGATVVVAKLAAAALALSLLRRPLRSLPKAAIVGGGLLAVYGAVLVAAGALVLGLVWLLWRVWRGADWLAATGWATLLVLVTSAWLLPWYVVWLLPLAAVAGGARLRIATLAFIALVVATHVARYGG